METYPNGPQIVQGQTVYKPTVTPQMQQAVQNNASLPNIVQSGYQYTPTNNTVASSGLNRSAEMANVKAMNQANYVVQDVENSNKVVLWIHNPGYRSNNLNLNHVPGNKQRDQVQNIQSTGQGMSNTSSANVATITTQKTFKNPNAANHAAKGHMKIPEPTHVNLNTHVNEKVGSLKIHISESFLPWNITNKTVLDLEFMRHLFSISGVDVILTDAKQNEKAIRAAVEQLLHSRVLPDWLVLKCEEKEIPFLKVNNQVEIYTASNFTALLNVVTQETCLPLPFIAEENNYIKYLYLNFPKTGNDKVKKLNTPIFHVADNGKKRLLCKYPGIRLDCDFEGRVESFIIHVHQSAVLAYETSVSKIRQYLIYRHVIWGFLQMWIRRVMEKYNQCFKFDDIAKNLSLCKFEDGKSCGNDNQLIYDIGYLNCYLKFDPVTLKEAKATFSLDNFSTNTVCNLAIVQFYKQFFLINDMHYSDALKNSALFFKDHYSKNVVRASSYVGVPRSLKSLILIPRTNESPPEQVVPLLNNTYKDVVHGNLSANTSGRAVSQAITIGSINKNVIQVGPNKTSAILVSEKPRLKARTVEEINSSVDLVNRTDVNNSVVAPDRSNTHTVEEINSSVDLVKRTEMNKRTVAPAVGQTPDAKQRDNTRRLNYGSFVSLIQKFMENCYASNRIEISERDESNDEVMIKRRFDEAVRRAIGTETIELFIEKIYVHLQMYYTNPTSQNILNKMIWRAIEAKYPHLKEHVSKNIAKSLRDKLPNGNPRDSNKSSSVLESHVRLNETVIANNQIGNQNSIPTLAVAQQPDVTNSNSEKVVCSGENDQVVCSSGENDQVLHSGKNDQVLHSGKNDQVLHSGENDQVLCSGKNDQVLCSGKNDQVVCSSGENDQVLCSGENDQVVCSSGKNDQVLCSSGKNDQVVCSSGENDQAVSAISKDQDAELENGATKRGRTVSSPCVGAEKITEQEPPVPPATEEPKDRNACSSESLEECLPSSGCERLLKKTKKHSKPRRSKESGKEFLPYRNTLTFVRVSTSPATFRISSRSEINSKTQCTELEENESCSALEENLIQASNEISETDRASEEPEQYAQTAEETEEVNQECPQQEDYSKYNLKPCSIVLNPNEVKMKLKKYRKKKRKEISLTESDVEEDEDFVPGRVRRRFSAEDSDDSDFITERKRIRRAVSEMQYMEARTRVLQRLRKRKSLYVGYERTAISGEELDSFLVRQGSLSKLNHQENSGEESEGEYEIGKRKDSEAEESQRRKTCTKRGPAIKEVRVVLVRLEDTPEYEKHRERLLRKEKWNPSVDYFNLKRFPHLKRKYFEIRDGTLYLKEGYSVKDGKIVRAEEVSPITPKREPESPARETDFDHYQIKKESILD